VTNKYIESLGLKSTNDRYLVAFLKDLNFLNSDGVPTEVWHSYRHTGEAKRVMASAIRVGILTRIGRTTKRSEIG
jgi:hypothetical protein